MSIRRTNSVAKAASGAGPAPGGAAREDDRAAVALGYDAAVDEAPKLLAKGRGETAERIIQVALEQGITIRRDADLAEILSALDLDTEIPVETFAAVAEILSYVYRANSEAGMPPQQQRQPHAQVTVPDDPPAGDTP